MISDASLYVRRITAVRLSRSVPKKGCANPSRVCVKRYAKCKKNDLRRVCVCHRYCCVCVRVCVCVCARKGREWEKMKKRSVKLERKGGTIERKKPKKEIGFLPFSRKCRRHIIIRGTYISRYVHRLCGRIWRLYIRIDRLYDLRINA